MEQVYVFLEYYDYEGSSLLSVHRTKESAVKAMIEVTENCDYGKYENMGEDDNGFPVMRRNHEELRIEIYEVED